VTADVNGPDGAWGVFQNQPLAERSKLSRAALEIASERGTGNRHGFGTLRGGCGEQLFGAK